EPDGWHRRGLPLGHARHAVALAPAIGGVHGCDGNRATRRAHDLPPHGAALRGRDLMEPVIVARDLAKRYSLGAQGRTSLRETIQRWGNRVTGRIQRPEHGDHWALRDVSFSVAPGETVGVVGNNGAGKSTLLKILSRITPPTRGTVMFRGRVGSLLE